MAWLRVNLLSSSWLAPSVLAALTALDNSGGEDQDEGPDPDAIKDLLEDALVLRGNANA